MKKHLLTLIVFSSGALVMILELLASRLFAPYLGTSLPVWSALIAVILGCLSLGYWYGGKLADRGANWKTFGQFFFVAAGIVFVTLLLQARVLEFLSNLSPNIYWTSITAALLLFGPVGVVLGFVSPYAVRLRLTQLSDSGQTIGNLYAWSTLGSIAGTLAAGFLLLPALGHQQLLWLCVVALLILGVLAYAPDSRRFMVAGLIACVILAFWGSLLLEFVKNDEMLDIDTQYSRVIIGDKIAYQGRNVRFWQTDWKTAQSAMFVDNPLELVHEYTKFYDLFLSFKPDATDALMIGGAAFSYPKYFLATYPDKRMDVVELDGAAVDLASQYFNLDVTDPRLQIFVQDARPFLRQNTKQYGAIFFDAFSTNGMIPHQLTTLEFAQDMFDGLTDDGVAVLNIISAVQGEDSRVLRALYKTYAQVFPNLYLFQVNTKFPVERAQNLILVADKNSTRKSDDYATLSSLSYWQNYYTQALDTRDVPVLTDDYSPADYYAVDMLY
ncbi:MAG TPA: fused MFS/spermidine synthase [bacterium]|nr:fused MFS/spermidine synthase [bacterium]